MSWYVMAAATFVIAIGAIVVLRDRPGYVPDGMESASSHGRVSWRKLYFSSSIWHLGAVYFCFGFAYMIYLTFFSKRLIADIGYTEQTAGTLFMILGWASLPCGILWGWIADIIGRKAAMTIILLIQATGLRPLRPLDRTRRPPALGRALWPDGLGRSVDHGRHVRGSRGSGHGPGCLRLPHRLPRSGAGHRALRRR